ncbi:pirin family protein [Saccharospirillum mangrovi]|uniref:pirin family protein n=1 Tax=Saccharospirillum mangrovi TaxID=2161747 RepID=UPI0013B368DE|nr:pirin family protein [Saccharospirillum mangrovi]
MNTPIDVVDLVIAPRKQSLMGLPIRRVLPWRGQRHCGPFVFLDHMGPHTLAPGEGLDVPPHPHIGLSTLTWLYAGQFEHRDSLGSVQIIRPGEVNWMTAGRGIVHSERSPDDERAAESHVEGLQFWVAQPQSAETGEPRFEHHAREQLPTWQDEQASWTLIAGQWQQQRSPVQVESELALLDVRTQRAGSLELPSQGSDWEWGLYPLSGAVQWQGQPLPQYHLGVTNQAVTFSWQADSHFVLFGGRTLGARRIDWNFVATNDALIDQARRDWQAHRFPPVPGDAGYVPYPGND